MLTLAAGQTEVPAFAASLVPWIPLMGVLVATGAGLINSWSARGESADLRQIKAMNEAIAGMPAGNSARDRLEEARDRLANRISSKDLRESRESTVWVWAGLALLATLTAAGVGFIGALEQQQAGSPLAADLMSALGQTLGFGVLTVIASAVVAVAYRRLTRTSRKK
ncbi:hypothetical protein NS220_06790 [Microbacterium testaceum]|uniref:Uncharacterized protein n=1 Tax=Microbacterium testaceum TaxID=2033 RepID=A0A147EZ42_MICTE|nr:hypothetical protein [Microbacterium testaceum]KTR95172.1 hypothetical protein NS220_06790 [Microbacterium testaceum]